MSSLMSGISKIKPSHMSELGREVFYNSSCLVLPIGSIRMSIYRS